jgi:hypothetical protein
MDVALFSGLRGTQITQLIISYDVACQYGAKFWSRHLKLPDEIQPDPNRTNVVFVIPKFHLMAHRTHAMRTLISTILLVLEGVTERNQKDYGPRSTRQHTAPKRWGLVRTRHDALDSQCNDSNYCKLRDLRKFRALIRVIGTYASVATLLLARFKEASRQMVFHRGQLEEFSNSKAESVLEWTRRIVEFEADCSKPNLYEGTVSKFPPGSMLVCVLSDVDPEFSKERQ